MRRRRWFGSWQTPCLGGLVLGLSVAAPSASAETSALTTVPATGFRMVAGRLEPRDTKTVHVSVPGMRAVVRDGTSNDAAMAFRYLGPTERTTPLASGELRRQIGLSLRAKNTCNVVYVMWHVSEPPGVFVSVKSNPSMSTHAECGDRGYFNAKPQRWRAPAPLLGVGERHVLRAHLDGQRLRVTADGAVVWEGELPDGSVAEEGPPGLRSDNAAFDFEYLVQSARATRSRQGNP